jgi:hypothetical protein
LLVAGDVVRSGRRGRCAGLVTRKGVEDMDIRLVCDSGVERHQIEELPELLEGRR